MIALLVFERPVPLGQAQRLKDDLQGLRDTPVGLVLTDYVPDAETMLKAELMKIPVDQEGRRHELPGHDRGTECREESGPEPLVQEESPDPELAAHQVVDQEHQDRAEQE